MMPTGPMPTLPLAATMDLQYRLPPIQQVIFTPTIMISLVLFGIALLLIVYFYRKSVVESRRRKRQEDLQLAYKLLVKRGGTEEDSVKMEAVFANHPNIDPAAAVMVQDVFHTTLFPILSQTYGGDFARKMEKIYFPPPKDTAAIAREKNLKKLVENTKNVAETQAEAAMIDLMDATLKPGAVLRVNFEGIEGASECLVMNHNMKSLNITLPANNTYLMESLRKGLSVEGYFESGPSLMAFTSTVLAVVGGNMPFCRLSIWRNAWEVRKRESVRLDITLEIDFQHISTASSASINMSQLEKEIGAVRPGRLVDLSLGGCALETPSTYDFHEGDFIRFTASLVPGHPAATLLGAIVDTRDLVPDENDGMQKRLGVQFLALDDVSQRLLARAMRQLQEASSRQEWLQAQKLLAQMRRNNVANDIASAAPSQTRGTGTRATGTKTRAQTRPGGAKTGIRPAAAKPAPDKPPEPPQNQPGANTNK